MKKIFKTKHPSLIEGKLKAAFPNYLHFHGTPEKMTFEFSGSQDEQAVDALLATLTDEALDAEVAKELEVTKAYNEMVEEVYVDMEAKLGSRSDASVNADVQTWQLMIQFPDDFLTEDLDTQAKVKAFATAKLKNAVAYVKGRQEKLKAFRVKRDAIKVK